MAKAKENLDGWRRLYTAAVEFRNLAPWNWMNDGQVFGVVDRKSGDTGYCCVLGASGEVFGMAIYRGPTGYAFYRDVQRSRISAERNSTALYEQDCLFSEFTTRDDLEPPDLKIIIQLGFEFRGGGFPFFRSWRPGLFPWFLEADEVEFMADCYENAVVVAKQMNTNPQFFEAPLDGQVLVRVPNVSGVWHDEWRGAAAAFPQQAQRVIVSSAKLAQANRAISQRQGIWELGFSYLPTPVKERGSRPIMPLIVMLMVQEAHYVLGQKILRPDENRYEAGVELLISAFHNHANGPSTLVVGNRQSLQALAEFGGALSINVEYAEQLPAFEDAMESLLDHMRQEGER